MIRVQAESTIPLFMNFSHVGLITEAPVLSLYAPMDPMNSLLPLWTMGTKYRSKCLPVNLKRLDAEQGTKELFKGQPAAMRNHMLCMLQPSFVNGVVAEMTSFLETIDVKGPQSQSMQR